ncbi:MAG TPA: hypothetical protein DHV55_11905, partial [Clostridiaceae bacterium]|nr:hypothetical protein [Clostridiaceae bacterium]
DTALVLIATLTKFHGTMNYIACELGFKNILKINDRLYAKIYYQTTPFVEYLWNTLRGLPKNAYIACLKKLRLRNRI